MASTFFTLGRVFPCTFSPCFLAVEMCSFVVLQFVAVVNETSCSRCYCLVVAPSLKGACSSRSRRLAGSPPVRTAAVNTVRHSGCCFARRNSLPHTRCLSLFPGGFDSRRVSRLLCALFSRASKRRSRALSNLSRGFSTHRPCAPSTLRAALGFTWVVPLT